MFGRCIAVFGLLIQSVLSVCAAGADVCAARNGLGAWDDGDRAACCGSGGGQRAIGEERGACVGPGGIPCWPQGARLCCEPAKPFSPGEPPRLPDGRGDARGALAWPTEREFGRAESRRGTCGIASARARGAVTTHERLSRLCVWTI